MPPSERPAQFREHLGLTPLQQVLQILHMHAGLPIPDAPDPELLELSLEEAERLTAAFFERQDREREAAVQREAAETVLAI